ncbi:nitrous oxide reductase family maturation protein NosD [Actinomadura sp. 9N407]|uniref:nitrous oxide reductase family maturation protein NosD n=1 Tax=Actinomadura sp. 9N407 TaxID=3375154 RepID=UPI0037A499C0
MRRTLAGSLATVMLLGGLAAFAPAGQASAVPSDGGGEIHVVKPGRSIQKAVNRAKPGDVIQLKAGHYKGGVLVRKRLTIRGVGKKTVLKPGGHDHCKKAKVPGMGICVIGTAKRPVKGVKIERLTVRKFKGSGVFGNYTDRLKVEWVHAKRNGEYGIAEYRSTRSRLAGNRTVGNRHDAGLYIGDIANSHGTVVVGNHASGNALGLLIRHARHIKVWGNTFVGNCTGVALVDDSQPGGQGHNRIWKNTISKNNRSCAPYGRVPALGGTGVLFFGGDHNRVENNRVEGNKGKLPYSGGIVLFPGTEPKKRPAHHNQIVRNIVRGNSPFDLVNKSGSPTNRFHGNNCVTSSPGGLC